MTQEVKGMDVSQLVTSSSATVHGVFVGAISPMKTSQKNSIVKYYESQLSSAISFNLLALSHFLHLLNLSSLSILVPQLV